MLLKLRSRLTYANVVASIALFIVLGGTSYGLATGSIGSREIKNNSVRGKDVRNNDVRGRDIRDGTIASRDVMNGALLAEDFRAGQLPAGQKGDTGATGQPGRSALEPLRSGETIRGVVGGDDHAPAVGDFGVIETFPIPAPEAVPDTKIDVDGSADEVGNRCTGSPSAPTAPPGVVCIYASDVANATSLSGGGAPDVNAGSPYGFRLIWGASASGDTLVYASWAYQAP